MSVGDEFKRLTADDELCAEVLKAVRENDTAALRRLGFGGFAKYAQRLSELMSDSVRESHDPKADDFAAIMGEVARPAHYAHHLVNEAGTAVQLAKDEPLGIHMKPIKTDFDDDALKSTVGNAASMDTPEKTVEALAEGLAYAIKKSGNDFIKANAEQRSRAGFEVSVKRSGSSKCCEWCAARIGSWALKNAPDGVFGCHANCSCTVEYTSSTGAKTSARGANLHRYGAGAFVEVGYEPPHVLSREEAHEKGGFDEPRRLTGGANGGIINAKISDRSVDLYDNPGEAFDMDLVDKILDRSWIGKESVEYFDEHGMTVSVYYNYDSEGVAGILRGRDVEIYALYNQDEEAVASTIIHEISHERFNWKGTQEAEVNCYLMEAMHQNMGMITRKDIKGIVNFVRKKYSHLPEGDLYGF